MRPTRLDSIMIMTAYWQPVKARVAAVTGCPAVTVQGRAGAGEHHAVVARTTLVVAYRDTASAEENSNLLVGARLDAG